MNLRFLVIGDSIVRPFTLACSALAIAGILAGCSTIYRSPSVKAGVSDTGKVRVVAMTPETVLVANRASYQPKTLPVVFGFSKVQPLPSDQHNLVSHAATPHTVTVTVARSRTVMLQ